jgi:hypothetical protein
LPQEWSLIRTSDFVILSGKAWDSNERSGAEQGRAEKKACTLSKVTLGQDPSWSKVEGKGPAAPTPNSNVAFHD